MACRVLGAALLLLSGAGSSTPTRVMAAGPNASVEREAKLWYERGKKAFDEARYSDAAEAYRKAAQTLPHPLPTFMAGRSYELLGRTEEAIQWFEKFLAFPAIAEERAAEARERIQRLRAAAVQAKYDAVLDRGNEALSLEAHDGAAEAFRLAYQLKPTVDALWAWAHALELGGHRGLAMARLDELLLRDDLTPDRRAIATDRLHALSEPEPGAAGQGTLAGPGSSDAGDTVMPSPWGWAALAVSAGTLGAGIGLHFHAESLRGKVLQPAEVTSAGTITSVSRVESLRIEDDANVFDTGGVVAMVLGSAGIVAAVTVLVATATGDDATTSTISVTAAPRGAGVLWRGSF